MMVRLLGPAGFSHGAQSYLIFGDEYAVYSFKSVVFKVVLRRRDLQPTPYEARSRRN